MLVFSIQCNSCFQFCDRMEGWGKRRDRMGGWGGVGLSGIEFGCLLIAKSRFNCSKKKKKTFCLRLDASVLYTGLPCICNGNKTFDSALYGFQCLKKKHKNVVRVAIKMYPGRCFVTCFFVLEIYSVLCIYRNTVY
jgi:hypothetical protein